MRVLQISSHFIILIEGRCLRDLRPPRFFSVALLVAIVAIIKERRLRLALQQILTRILKRWRTDENTQVVGPLDRRDADGDVARCSRPKGITSTRVSSGRSITGTTK